MVYLNPNMSVIALSVDRLNYPNRRTKYGYILQIYIISLSI